MQRTKDLPLDNYSVTNESESSTKSRKFPFACTDK